MSDAPPAPVVPPVAPPASAASRLGPVGPDGWAALNGGARRGGQCALCHGDVNEGQPAGWHAAQRQGAHWACVEQARTPRPAPAPRTPGTVYQVTDPTHPWRVEGSDGRFLSEAVARDAVRPAPAPVAGPGNFSRRAAVSRPSPSPVAPAPVGLSSQLAALEGALSRGRGYRVPEAAPAAPAQPLIRQRDFTAALTDQADCGILNGWSGRGAGDLTQGQTVEILAIAGLPAEWAAKAPGAEGAAGDAVSAVASAHGLKSWRERTGGRWARQRGQYDARWQIQRPGQGADVGDPAGRVACVVELLGERLTVRGDELLAGPIRERYQAARAAQNLTDPSAWIVSVLRQFRALRYALGWYVPAEHRAACERFVSAVAPVWGSSWADPPLPVATTPQLRAGLGAALAAEVRKLIRQWIDAAPADRPALAAALTAQLPDLGERVRGHGALLGPEAVAEVRAAVEALRMELGAHVSDHAARFAGIFAELDREERSGQ